MSKLTLGQIRNKTRIPQALGLCPSDARIPQFLNEAVQRVLGKGLWIGTVGRFRLCLTDGCCTLPPQIAALERISICGQPVPIHDYWFEFLDNGFGPRSAACNGSGGCGLEEANLRGWFPSFADIRGTGKKLRFACDLSTDVGKTVLALGYDENGNWIRTPQPTLYEDGELIVLAQAPGTDSTKQFSSLTGIQFPDDRDGQVWLWERDVALATSRLIGSYQYWEENPSYPRYYFPSIRTQTTEEGGCATTLVEAIAKLEFIPVVKDTDYLLITCVPALKEMCVAIKKAEDQADSSEANNIIIKAEAVATRYLDEQIDFCLGQGREVGLNIRGSNIGTTRPIEALL
jgi:hypothetical protein